MDFLQIYQDAQKELTQLGQEKAVIESKISSLVSELKLDEKAPLDKQVTKLISDLEKKIKSAEKELEGLVAKLDNPTPSEEVPVESTPVPHEELPADFGSIPNEEGPTDFECKPDEFEEI